MLMKGRGWLGLVQTRMGKSGNENLQDATTDGVHDINASAPVSDPPGPHWWWGVCPPRSSLRCHNERGHSGVDIGPPRINGFFPSIRSLSLSLPSVLSAGP